MDILMPLAPFLKLKMIEKFKKIRIRIESETKMEFLLRRDKNTYLSEIF